mmetsp:Transcript_62856/g.149778  ORF Transcript_62856/g.149778 Transcript_62856/m.149778 type:complete len:496 (+) Transcript_62856:170-1657(+)|eukprot:CAMPEP_0180150458 /NCGR_PEP_ID=MMETSP0986-20121125/21463_1 /TAXON_ID=697907 /ORGANISM="non described non described, Strain CCMP2293" /LENGTH=495 /DNA_ID=CAMNT_0022097401 /DNA_START=165 /DNA_END=1652 /DNA_ORIENTATION=-
MASTLVEQARVGHEEMELGVKKLVKLLGMETKTHKQKLMQQHQVLQEAKRMQDQAKKLSSHYIDADGSYQQEKETMSGGEVFGGFYNKLRELREYHRKFPNLYYETAAPEQEITLADDPAILERFSGEEMYGRFLDLTPHHLSFINLKGAKAVTYEVYLNIFLNFADVPESVRGARYRDYLQSLKDYLLAFLSRAQPLVDVTAALEDAKEEAEEKADEESAKEVSMVLNRAIDLDVVEGPEELEGLGMEALKQELTEMGLKAGGNIKERAVRLFQTKGKNLITQIDQKLLAVHALPKDSAKSKALKKEIKVLEMQVEELGDVLKETISGTTQQIQKKQSRTTEELAQEVENEMGDEAPESDSDDDGAEKPIYNPKKVPLDWTGKPIPYWLYKLHGLNLEFKCEICGNYSYWGPRAFERHFQEWRHAHGMKVLKIPNTRAFHNIVKIQEAVDLSEKIKAQAALKDFDAAAQEEYEDGLGNVLSKKTYNDLLRQGLL